MRGSKLLGSLAALGVAWSTWAVPSYGADSVEYELKIEPQALGTALQEFSKQSGVQVVFLSKITDGLEAPAVKGRFTADGALQRLLNQSPLTYRELNPNTIEVQKKSESQDTSARIAGEGLRLALAEKVASKEAGKISEETLEEVQPEIPEILVTAQKREERLIDTPQSVSVLSSEVLNKLGATQFRDFANTIPGLNFTTEGAGSTKISLRGVTVGADTSPTVGVYVDEVPYGGSTQFVAAQLVALDVGLFDLDRVEVLRGPQGTLYGASTMGGLIKYVSKRPDASRFSVDAQTGIADTRDGGVSYRGAATINAPLVTDKAALRITGFYSHDSGYIDNLALDRQDVNRSNIYGGRADLQLIPTEALSIRLTSFLQDVSRDGGAVATYTFAGDPLDHSLDQRRLLSEPFDSRFRLVSGTIDLDLGTATLTSISSYQTNQGEYVRDASMVFVPLLASFARSYSAVGFAQGWETDKFTQEVRLATGQSGLFEWIVGGFYTHETSDRPTTFSLRDLAGQPVTNDVLASSLPSRYEEYAAFGDLTWYLNDKFNMGGGARYARNRQSFEQTASGLFAGFLVVPLPSTRSTEDVFTYLAHARYSFSDRATAYVRYATGYRPGGPNYGTLDATTGLPVGPPTFEADRLKSYEVGFKAETTDRRFGLDLAAYDIDWENIQLFVVRGGGGAIINAPGGASIRGAELTLSLRPTHAFATTGAFAYQDAQLAQANSDLGGARGERLPNVPRFTGSVSLDYQLPVENLQPAVGATLRYVGDRSASFDGRLDQYRMPDYATVDFRTELALGAVNVQVYVHNLFDERGQLSEDSSFGLPAVAILQPRTIGITATTRF